MKSDALAPAQRVTGLRRALIAAALALVAAGCTAPTPTADGRLQVNAEVYPLAWLATQVGGDRVEVTQLIPGGADAHGYELSPRQVSTLSKADLAIYIGSFATAVDQGVAAAAPRSTLDLATVLPARPAVPDADDPHPGERAIDPHLWLDPAALPTAVDSIAAKLGDLDPTHLAEYRTRADALTKKLNELDADYRAGLASCKQRTVIVTHPAFGYLTARYGLDQVGISGVDEDTEPSPAKLAEVADLAKRVQATTLFVGSDSSASVADGIAQALSLNPVKLSTITTVPAGADYLSQSRANLETLRRGLGCS